MASSLIVCIGNDLVADDAVGHAIHRVLADSSLPEGTTLKFLGLGGMDLIEVSGGITPDNITNYTYADVISLGWLTHSVQSADLSLELRRA